MKFLKILFNFSVTRRGKKVLTQSYKVFFLLSLTIGIILLIPHFIYPSLKASKTDPIRNLHPAARVIHPSQIQYVNTHVVDSNLDSGVEEYLKNINFNGSVLVVKDNKVVLNKGFGYADFPKKLPNTSETVFYIGSITKVFISTSIMQLQEQGKLNITDPLSKYIPDFPHGKQITLYHLLTHTSGIPQHSEPKEKISQVELIKKIEKAPLLFQPGTNWYYSDSNYSILGYIVEKVSGEPLDQYVKENIFNKADMNHTGFGDSFYHENSVSVGYKQFGNERNTTTLPDMSQLFGCGDIYSTPFDLYLFDKALYTGKLLSQNSLKQFFTPSLKHNYALGLDVKPDGYFDHGVLPGWNCLNSFSKNGDEFTIMLSNIQNGMKSIGDVSDQIYKLLRKQPSLQKV